jgi:hypothetical protein
MSFSPAGRSRLRIVHPDEGAVGGLACTPPKGLEKANGKSVPGHPVTRTAANAHAANPAADPATTSEDEAPDQTHVVFSRPSRLLPVKALRRSLEFTQYVSIRYTERLAEAGIEPSVGSRGDSYDNALAETIIGLYKTEVIRKNGRWKNLDEIEFARLEWVDWFNHRRLLGSIGNVPPAEFEAMYHAGQQS